jgi:nitrogen fixation NifU-like protein
MSDKIYQEELMEHFKNPRNKNEIKNPDFSASHINTSCGDKIGMQGKIKNDVIAEIGFTGSGCVISQAAASMLTDQCLGKTIQDVIAMSKDDVLNLVGIQLGPNRLKCALLGLAVLQDALKNYKNNK